MTANPLVIGGAIATVIVATLLAVGAGIGWLTDDARQPIDICDTAGWPPPSYCYPPGWKIIGPDGTIYRGGALYQ